MRVAPPEKLTPNCLNTPYASERSEEEIAESLSLLRRLGRDHWLRCLAHPYTGIAQVPGGQLLALLAQVSGDYELHWRESLLAVSLLGQIELPEKQAPSALKELGELLDRQARKPSQLFSHRSAHSSRRAFFLALGVSGLIAIFHRMGFPMVNADDTLLTLLILFCVSMPVLWAVFKAALLPFSMALDASRGARVRAAAARTLGRWRSPRSAAALAKAAHDPASVVRLEALKALPGVLANLTDAHYGTLPSETVPALCRLLEGRGLLGLDTTQRWRVQILAALEKVGDGRAVATVAPLAHHSHIPEIQREAQRVLPTLESRLREEQSRQTLLRSSLPPQEPFRELLHPVSEAVSLQEELLRSHAAG